MTIEYKSEADEEDSAYEVFLLPSAHPELRPGCFLLCSLQELEEALQELAKSRNTTPL